MRTRALQVECEIHILKKASCHPNIVDSQGWYYDESHILCMVLGYCAGGSLDALIGAPKAASKSYFSEEQIMLWVVQLLAALNHLHSVNIIHRDIKPQNCFLSKCKRLIRLGDLGVAKELQSADDLVTTCLGTPQFMAPEILGRQPYTLAADVWALGYVYAASASVPRCCAELAAARGIERLFVCCATCFCV